MQLNGNWDQPAPVQSNLSLTPFPVQSLGIPDISTIGMQTPSIGDFTPTSQILGQLPNIDPMTGAAPRGWLGIQGLGPNLESLNLGLKGLGTLGSLWGAFQAAHIANKQLNFAKATTNANLANQTQAYNTSIQDRARARGKAEGQSQGQIADYIAQNSLQQRHV
jgi:hypothetical protein